MLGKDHNFVVVKTSDKGYVLLNSYQSLWNLKTWLGWLSEIQELVSELPISNLTDYLELIDEVTVRIKTNIVE